MIDEIVDMILHTPHLFKIGTKAIYIPDQHFQTSYFAVRFYMNASFDGMPLFFYFILMRDYFFCRVWQRII
jgi:hypothetical protein